MVVFSLCSELAEKMKIEKEEAQQRQLQKQQEQQQVAAEQQTAIEQQGKIIYENTSIEYTEFSYVVKIDNFQ